MVSTPDADPIGRYAISDEDMEGSIYYYGYVDRDGNWYIMKYNRTVETAVTYTYIRGNNQYSAAWDQRRNNTYKRFNEVF